MTKRMLDCRQAVLLVVDIQEKFVPVIDEYDRVIENTRVLIEAAKLLKVPILLSEQYPKGLGRTVEKLREALPESAIVMGKTAFGCLGEESIVQCLKGLARKQVIVAGIEAHVCVNQTVHQLLEGGYEPHLIEDALCSRDSRNRVIAISKMTDSGAVLSCVEMALFELMRHSLHGNFKAVQALIK